MKPGDDAVTAAARTGTDTYLCGRTGIAPNDRTMMRRIVRMTFRPEAVDAFLQIFEESKDQIRAFPGCLHLELWRDRSRPEVYFTYSLWSGPDALEAYRHSDLFRKTWARTKVLFAERPQAWSLDLVQMPERHPVIFGPAARNLESLLARERWSRVAVLVDENTEQHCYPRLAGALPPDHLLIRIPAGETHKNLDTCRHIWSQMLEARLDRQALLVNLGGGVVGDMGGFCAVAWKRGIRFVQLPTTLLAQVDASTGGKLGIDFEGVKNIIGAFADPLAVLVDTDFLATLPFAELRSGFAEVIKHALIADADQWESLRHIEDLRAANWAELVPRSLAVKRRIVAADPFERGLRKALNFGHTIGHAIESAALLTDRPLLHGEAIAIGMVCESWLSAKKVGLPPEELEQITSCIRQIFGYYPLNNLAKADLLALMRNDKKNEGAGINFSLLPRIGQVVVNQTATPAEIEASLEYYEQAMK